jgi:hypothetical protein
MRNSVGQRDNWTSRCRAALGAAMLLSYSFNAWCADESTTTPADSSQHQYTLGPIKLSFGPESDGYFGAVLKGDKSLFFANFKGLPDPKNAPDKDTHQFFSYGSADLTLDAGWSSAPAANNNATVSIKPAVTAGVVKVSPHAPLPLTAAEQAVCDKLSDDFAAALVAKDNVKIKEISGEFLKDKCNVLKDPYTDLAALSFYPSFEYRFGHFSQNGQQYQANQAIVGGGARLLFPWELNSWLASWPFISATYYHVKDNSGSTIPVPDSIKADYISTEAKFDLYLPVTIGKQSKALQLVVDFTESKATTGSDKQWHSLSNIQLLANLGSNWKPALTYREGKDRGLSYDKQVILGVATDLL